MKNRTDEIYILDKGVEENKIFFKSTNEVSPYIHKVVNGDFSFYSYKGCYKNTIMMDSSCFDVVLLRIDRPISDHFLEFIGNYFSGSLIINNPKGILETSSKEYLFNFKQFCPEMKLCSSFEDVIRFSSCFPIVIKPLKGFGGKGVFKLINDKVHHENIEISFEHFRELLADLFEQEERCIAVRYLKNIALGDKRILVVNGEIIGAFNRVPQQNSWLANVSQGASSESAIVSEREKSIASELSTNLEKKGIIVFGFDIIKGDQKEELLSEINTLNVGGFYQLDELNGNNSISSLVDNLYGFINQKLIG